MRPTLDDKQLAWKVGNLKRDGEGYASNFFQAEQIIRASGLDCYSVPYGAGYRIIRRNG
jgi:hypothetical protein